MDPRRAERASRPPARCRCRAEDAVASVHRARRRADRRAAPRLARRGAREPRPPRASTSPSRTRPQRRRAAGAEWTRIGRCLAADVRFDDPTVSRRHALIVSQADGVRVLDDRSLNGVFVNGERVEWRPLTDGDEIIVGRHRLHFLDDRRRRSRAAAQPAAAPAPASADGATAAAAAVPCRAAMAETIAVLSQKGGTGKTTTVRTLDRRPPALGLDVLGDRPRPAGQPLRLLRRRRPTPRRPIGDVLAGRGEGQGGRPRRRHPGQPDPRRGRALARRARWAAS